MPGTLGRKPILGSKTEEILYRSALRCVQKVGIRRTTINQVAKESGLSRTAIYHYFPSKRELVLGVIARQLDDHLAAVEQRTRALTGFERVVEAAWLCIEQSLSNKVYLALARDPEAAANLAGLLDHEGFRSSFRGFWKPLLQGAAAEGMLRTDRGEDDLIRWLFYLLFTLAQVASPMHLSHAELREWVRSYIAASLRLPGP